MAEIRGVLTTLNNALPAGVDPTRLAQWRLRGGRSYEAIRADIVTAFDSLNEEILTGAGKLAYVTFEDMMEYPDGGAISDFPEVTDLDRIESTKSTTVGHSLPLSVRMGSIGGTLNYFRDLREAQLLAQIRGIVMRGRQTFERSLLTRLFNNTSNALGTSGYDVPFANASSGVTYTPPAYGGKTFASSHNHYTAIDTSGNDLADLLNALVLNVFEHGHSAPFDAIVAEADASLYRALTDYVQPINNNIIIVDKGGLTTGAQYFERGEVGGVNEFGARFIGSFQSDYGEVRLHATSRVPAKYAAVYKSEGLNNEMNPLAIRVHPDVGFGFRILEEPSWESQFPVKTIYIQAEYGVGVGMDRTKAAAGYLVSGAVWVNPTIG